MKEGENQMVHASLLTFVIIFPFSHVTYPIHVHDQKETRLDVVLKFPSVGFEKVGKNLAVAYKV